MKKNMGIVDRLIRTALAVAVVILYLSGQLTGIAAIVLGIFAVIFLITSAIGFCPLYAVLGLSTLSKGEHGSHEAHP